VTITSVAANNRRHAFEVHTLGRDFVLPYTKVELVPSVDDPIVEIFVDPELANEAFTYRLKSGLEDSIHIDAVLEYNQDPAYMADLALYQLTVNAKRRLAASGLSIREVSRLMGTSPSQLYRLLDTTNYAKSARQLLALMYLLGWRGPVGFDAADASTETLHMDEPS
jgi:hypothetical protein